MGTVQLMKELTDYQDYHEALSDPGETEWRPPPHSSV